MVSFWCLYINICKLPHLIYKFPTCLFFCVYECYTWNCILATLLTQLFIQMYLAWRSDPFDRRVCEHTRIKVSAALGSYKYDPSLTEWEWPRSATKSTSQPASVCDFTSPQGALAVVLRWIQMRHTDQWACFLLSWASAFLPLFLDVLCMGKKNIRLLVKWNAFRFSHLFYACICTSKLADEQELRSSSYFKWLNNSMRIFYIASRGLQVKYG